MLCLSVANTIVKQNTRIAIFYKTVVKPKTCPRLGQGLPTNQLIFPPGYRYSWKIPPELGEQARLVLTQSLTFDNILV
jgi:hypothetical protein